MSPVSEKLLFLAYENYRKTGNYFVSIQAKNTKDWSDMVVGVLQLSQDGYVDEVPYFLTDSPLVSDPIAPITFNLTEKGIEWMCNKGKADH